MNPIQEYFINPIMANGWFNPVNTVVYGIILVIAVWAVYKLLVKMKIPIDRNFGLAVLPFIFWGASTRVLHDAAVAGALSPELTVFYSMKIFPTPGSYIITFSLALGVLLVSLLVQKFMKYQYWKTMLGAGVALSAINVALLPWVNFFALAIILPITLGFAGLFVLWRRFNPKLFSWPNIGILSAHFFDASATVVALTVFGYLEQHVVPRLFFPILGPPAMFILKAVVIIPVLWAIDKYMDDGNFKNFLKIVILILGLAPGLRDTIRLAAMV